MHPFPLILILSLCISATALAQQTVAEWQTKAMQAYPELSVTHSSMNKRFLHLHQQLKESNPEVLENPKWPFLVAELIGGEPEPVAPSPPFFIVVTEKHTWADGLTCSVGEVERVLEMDAESFVLWYPSGNRYKLPRKQAQVISHEDASLRLLAHRQQLYERLANGNQPSSVTLEQLQQIMEVYTKLQQLTKPQGQHTGQEEQSGPPDAQTLELIERLRALKGDRGRARQKQTPEQANAWWQEYQRQQQLNQMQAEINRLRQQQN